VIVVYKVVHCGTGNIGAVALWAILEHPDLELVGHGDPSFTVEMNFDTKPVQLITGCRW
jgi:hypothetical protein